MAKPKRRHLVAVPNDKNNPSSEFRMELPREAGWVMVKKQIITILIPPLPVTIRSVLPNPDTDQAQVRSEKATNTPSLSPICISSERPMVSERTKVLSSSPEKAFPTSREVPADATYPNPPRQDRRMGLENPLIHGCRSCKELRLYNAPNLVKQSTSLLDGNMFLNQRMRASNLEKKLRRAGGLCSWLASLGLGHFVKIFQGKRIGKFQLVNLTMKKLKDMGADAVGPRRKLMHAIDCLCQ